MSNPNEILLKFLDGKALTDEENRQCREALRSVSSGDAGGFTKPPEDFLKALRLYQEELGIKATITDPEGSPTAF